MENKFYKRRRSVGDENIKLGYYLLFFQSLKDGALPPSNFLRICWLREDSGYGSCTIHMPYQLFPEVPLDYHYLLAAKRLLSALSNFFQIKVFLKRKMDSVVCKATCFRI